MDELSEEDKAHGFRAAAARKIERFLSQPFHVAEVFTGSPGVFCRTRRPRSAGFKGPVRRENMITCRKRAFYMVGTIEQAVEKGKKARGRKRRDR